MSLLTVAGTYDEGNIALSEQPEGVAHARVLVTFLTEDNDASASHNKATALMKLLDQMEKGIDFGDYRFDREEIYRERIQKLEERRS